MASTNPNKNNNVAVATRPVENAAASPSPAKRQRVDDGGQGVAASIHQTTTTTTTTTSSKFQATPGLTNQNKKDGIPPWRKLQEVLFSEERVAQVLIEKEIIQVPTLCPKCHQSIKLPTKGVRLRCKKCYSRNGGEWTQSLLKGTFFEFGRLKVHDMLMFLYHWLCGAQHKQLCLLMGWSNSTMFRWVSNAQELVAAVTFYHSMDEPIAPIIPIGGVDVVVQLDDCSLDQRHTRHPQYVPGGWIFCGVEVTPKRRFFSCVVADPSQFMALVRTHIAVGSILKSHNWSSHQVMEFTPGCHYRHQTQQPPQPQQQQFHNHALVFDNPHQHNPFVHPFPQHPPMPMPNALPTHDHRTLNNINTRGTTNNNNNDETTWIVLEEPLAAPTANGTTHARKHNNVKELQGNLFEFIWRKQHQANLWNALLWTIQQVKYEM